MTNRDGPLAFPTPDAPPSSDFMGLTRREYFACHIMAGFSADPEYDAPASVIASYAVECADELIAKLDGGGG